MPIFIAKTLRFCEQWLSVGSTKSNELRGNKPWNHKQHRFMWQILTEIDGLRAFMALPHFVPLDKIRLTCSRFSILFRSYKHRASIKCITDLHVTPQLHVHPMNRLSLTYGLLRMDETKVNNWFVYEMHDKTLLLSSGNDSIEIVQGKKGQNPNGSSGTQHKRQTQIIKRRYDKQLQLNWYAILSNTIKNRQT